MKLANYIWPPIFYVAVAVAGSSFTAGGMDAWYAALAKPAWTPPGSVIGAVWTLIYILCAFSLIVFLKSGAKAGALAGIAALYVFNGVVNAAWSWIFFSRQMLGAAVLDAALIWTSVLAMVILVRPHSRPAAWLLAPYLAWVTFATFLSWKIYGLN